LKDLDTTTPIIGLSLGFKHLTRLVIGLGLKLYIWVGSKSWSDPNRPAWTRLSPLPCISSVETHV